ncbi:MAG: hypothetical protein A2X36_16095 [Elusimicrobia bacterium GWA2_69_24]|nr:MAG: hypothetical protein A2X36_16095 [Elusimicrobia bacterium GWA2_69_24]HBL17886.1 hypothetical protein [Elusimicrobiota bacterium]
MGLQESVDQLSFGRSIPKMDTCLGIYLSQEVLFLTELRLEGGKPKVLHLLRLPVPGDAAGKQQTKTLGTLNTDFLSDHEKLVRVLQKAISDVGWKSKNVVVSLSHQFGILRYFTLPAIDRRFWKSAVPVEAKKYIPIPFASLLHDYQVRSVPPGSDRKPRLGCLFGVTHRKNVDGIQAIMQKLGLTLVGVELAPCSVERLWDTLDPAATKAPYAQVHFDGGHVRILVSEEGIPIFFRDVFLPEGATVMDRRKVDLNGCIDFTRKQLGAGDPKKVRMSGTLPDKAAWQEAFSQDVGQQVIYQETDQMLGLRGGQWGGYAAIGAALRYLGPTALGMDLSAVGKITDDDRRTALSILGAAAILAAIFLIIGGFRYAVFFSKRRVVEGLAAQGAIAEAFRGKTSDEIESMITGMRNKVGSMGAVSAQNVPLTEILAAVAETIPDSAWVLDLNYDNPSSVKGGKPAPRTLNITGSVADKSRAMEQDIAYRFATNLKEHKRFAESLPYVEPEVEAPRETTAGEGTAAAPTSFRMRCASEKGAGR